MSCQIGMECATTRIHRLNNTVRTSVRFEFRLKRSFFCSHSGSFVPLLSSALTLGVLVKRQFTLFIIWFLIWNICNYFRKEQVIWIWLCSLYHPRQHFIRNPRWWCAIAIAILHFAFQNGTEPTTTTMTMAKKKEFNMRKTTNGRKFFAASNEKQRTKMHTDKRVKNSACATRAPFLNWNESKARSNTLTHTHTKCEYPNANCENANGMRIIIWKQTKLRITAYVFFCCFLSI